MCASDNGSSRTWLPDNNKGGLIHPESADSIDTV
jgi:hypothetical protein